MTMDVSKYVRIPPSKKDVMSWILKTPFGNISILSNVSICLERFISSKYISNVGVEECMGQIVALVDKGLFKDLGISRYPDSGGYISKEQIGYSPVMENVYYQLENRQMLVNHVPYRSIRDFSITNNQETIVCPDSTTLRYLLPSAIKNVVSVMANKQGYVSMHCAAVEKNGAAYLIVGRGRSGKSTLYMNLLENGMNPLNDDIIFIRSANDSIYMKTIPMFTKFRLSSIPYVSSRLSFEEYDSSITLEHEIYIDCEKRYQVKNHMQGTVRAVIFPRINAAENRVKITSFEDKKKELFREIVTQQTTVLNDNLVEIYKCFKNIPFYDIELTTNGNEACQELKKVLVE